MPIEDHYVTKSLFKVPLYQRIIKDSSALFFGKETCMELDGVGFYLRHDKEGQQYDKDWIRRHGAMREQTCTIVEAEDIESAIRKIIDEWNGCKVGGEEEEAKALWINRKEVIKELPPCESYWIRVNLGDVICGKPKGKCGHFGCGFAGFDFREDCAGEKFSEKVGKDLVNNHWVDKVAPNVVTVDGREYKFITWRSI